MKPKPCSVVRTEGPKKRSKLINQATGQNFEHTCKPKGHSPLAAYIYGPSVSRKLEAMTSGCGKLSPSNANSCAPPVTLGIGTSHWNGCRSMQLPQGCNILENIRWGFITLEGIFYSWWKFLSEKSKQSLAKHIIPSWITVSIPKAPAQQKPYNTINKYKQIDFA